MDQKGRKGVERRRVGWGGGMKGDEGGGGEREGGGVRGKEGRRKRGGVGNS